MKKIPGEILGSERGGHQYSLPPPAYSAAGEQAEPEPLMSPHLCWSAGFMAPGSLRDVCALGSKEPWGGFGRAELREPWCSAWTVGSQTGTKGPHSLGG